MLPAQERKLLSETRNILEELLETEEVLRDRALTKSIKDSQKDAKAIEDGGLDKIIDEHTRYMKEIDREI
jgi:predicted TIM-barrel enzyme